MRNNKGTEILKNSKELKSDDTQFMYTTLKMLFTADGKAEQFAKIYYDQTNRHTIDEVAEEMDITKAEAERLRQVLLDTIATCAQEIEVEKLEEITPTLLDSEDNTELLINNIDKMDTRAKETRSRKYTKSNSTNNAELFGD